MLGILRGSILEEMRNGGTRCRALGMRRTMLGEMHIANSMRCPAVGMGRAIPAATRNYGMNAQRWDEKNYNVGRSGMCMGCPKWDMKKFSPGMIHEML